MNEVRGHAERIGASEEEILVSNIISPDWVSSQITQTELLFFNSLLQEISTLELSEQERLDKIGQIDRLSFDVTGHEISTLGYYFPNELLAFVQKEDYRETGMITDIGDIDNFSLLADGKMMLSGDKRTFIIDQDPKNKLPLAQMKSKENRDRMNFPTDLIGVFPNGDHSYIQRQENMPGLSTLTYINHDGTGCALKPRVEGAQFIEPKRAIVKTDSGFFCCYFSEKTKKWGWWKIYDMPYYAEFRVFINGKMIVQGEGNIFTFELDKDNGYQMRPTSASEIKTGSSLNPDGINQTEYVSGNEIATVHGSSLFSLKLDNSGVWKRELIESQGDNNIWSFRTLPNGKYLVLRKDQTLRFVDSSGSNNSPNILAKKWPDEEAKRIQISSDGRIFVLIVNKRTGLKYFRIYDGTPEGENK